MASGHFFSSGGIMWYFPKVFCGSCKALTVVLHLIIYFFSSRQQESPLLMCLVLLTVEMNVWILILFL